MMNSSSEGNLFQKLMFLSSLVVKKMSFLGNFFCILFSVILLIFLNLILDNNVLLSSDVGCV